MNRRVLINLAFFGAVFAVMLVWAARNLVTVEALERPYDIAAEFDAAVGIMQRSEVAYLGVGYGYVDRVERIDRGVRIHMKIDRDRRIPAGSTAHIFRKSAIGEPFIDFAPPTDGDLADGPFIEPGEVVPRERTAIPLEFSELLRAASELLGNVSPEATRTLVTELAAALEGRGPDLRRLTEAGDHLSATFAERTDVLDRLAVNSTRLTRVMAEHRGSFGRSVSDLADLAESLRRSGDDLAVVLDQGSRLITEAADLVGGQKANLDCILSDLEVVLGEATTPERLAGLRTLLQVGPRAFGNVFRTLDEEPDGPWVRVGIILNPENPSQQYVPPKSLPEVPPVPACDSPLQAAPAGARPASAPADPAPAAPLVLLAGLGLGGGAVVLRVTRIEEAP